MRRPSVATLKRARRMNRVNLPDRAVARIRGERVDDGEGGFTYPEPEHVEFDCRIQSGASAAAQVESVIAEQLREPGRVLMAYLHDMPLPATATVTVTREGGAVEAYGVIGLIPDPSYAVMRRAVLQRSANVEVGA